MRIFKINTEDTSKCITIGYPKIVEDCGITIEEYVKKQYFKFFKSAFYIKDFELYKIDTNKLKEITNEKSIKSITEDIMWKNMYSDNIFKIILKNDCLESLKKFFKNYEEEWIYQKYKYKKIKYKQEYEVKQNINGTYYIKCLNVKYNEHDMYRTDRHNLNFYISCNYKIEFYRPVYKNKKNCNYLNFLFNNEIIKVTKDNIKEKIEEACKSILKKEIITEEDWKLIILNDLMKNV